MTASTDPNVIIGVAVAIAAAAVIVLVIVATKGHGGASQGGLSGVPAANALPTESTPTESTATESTSTETTTAATIENSQVEQVLSEYTQDYSNEDLGALKGLFAENLERRDGTKAPEDLSATLATYEHQFGELQSPRYSLSTPSIEAGSGEASASAQYTISSQNGTVTGSIVFHLTEQGEKLLIDKLTIEPAK